jgi:gliding motility-associated lipoprotein GldJ
MRKKPLIPMLVIIFLTSGLFLGCSKSRDYKNSSRATGWKLNDREGGFQFNTRFKEQEPGPGLVFIEGGTFTMGKVQDDPMRDWNNVPNQQHVQSFYMDETEVTNLMYLEYLDWVKKVFPPDNENYRKIYEGVLPDTLVWRNRLGFNETMTNNYLRHPAFSDYPVVGVSWIQAVEFSKWRTDRVNEYQLEKEGYTKKNARLKDVDASTTFSTYTYLQSPNDRSGGHMDILQGGKTSQRKQKDSLNQFVKLQDGVFYPDYRLPTEAEWEYAALGLGSVREYNMYRGKKKYPWDGQYTRSGSRRTRGDQMANFKQGRGDYGGIAGWSDDGADITNAVKSYKPNDFGLYDMAGNVAEWVADVYRPIIDSEFNDFNYHRGNIYTKNAIDETGKVVIVTTEDIVYDTLSNGKIIARNFPGEILQVPVDENETYLRTNFSESDQRNFRDGDKRSNRNFYNFGMETEEGVAQNTTNEMYNSPQHLVESDSLGGLIRQYDKANDRTTLINDNVRVYKGGSWRDRNYWLDPAQRRYFPQDMATDYIGFRNAMSRVGSKSQKGKRARN